MKVTVKLAGALSAVRLPAACARCGSAPDGTLSLVKVFRAPDGYGVTGTANGVLVFRIEDAHV